MTKDELFKKIEENTMGPRCWSDIRAAVDAYTEALIAAKTIVSGWQDFPAQKPTEGQLLVMAFDDERFYTHYYTLGIEENFRPFRKMKFVVLPAFH